MNLIKPTAMAIALLLLSFVTLSQEKYSQVKIYAPTDRNQFSSLMGLLEVDHFNYDKDGAVIVEIGEHELQTLRSTTYRYEIVIDDLVKHLDSSNREYYRIMNDPNARVAYEQPGGLLNDIIPTPSAFEVKPTFGGYYSFAEMEAAMDALVAAYPGIASKTSIGTTYGGRNIWVIKISDNVGTDEANEPEMLYMGLQHAREAITGASMIFLMQYLCENYGTDIRIQHLIDNRVFYIIPCFNPDGWEYNRTSQGGNAGGMWRKNRKPTSGGYYGVDLNRNWGVDWANCSAPIQGSSTSCGSGSVSSDTYYGPSAFSEAENQAVRTFAQSKNLVIGFDQHAYGPYYSLPFGRQSLHAGDMSTKGNNFFTAVPALMGKYNGMRAADSYDALGYEVAGGFKDWMLMGDLGVGNKDTVWAMTGEGGAAGASSSFWPSASNIVSLCKGMTYQNIQLAYAAGTYVDIQDVTDIALSSFTGNMQFRVKRLGLGNSPVTVTMIPIDNVSSVGSPVVINSMNYYDEYTGSISYNTPSLKNGEHIRFAWKIDAGGYTYSDTIIKIYNPTVLLNDDMEGSLATNWDVPSGGSASNKWGFTSVSSYSGSQSLSESMIGNYPGGASRTVTYNDVLDLSSSTAAYLTFWVKHRAENFRDKLQVRVDDGTGWTAIPGKTTVQEPGTLDGSTLNGNPSLTGIKDYWVKEVFDLSDYNGNASLGLQFIFTSNNISTTFAYDEDDGFYIDDVKVVKTTAPLVILPARFLSFEGQLQADATVKLNWKAETDDMHDHFEVEKSTNGMDFVKLGSVTGGAPYSFIDANPSVGNNYYRIRQVDKDGKAGYSKTINILYNKGSLVTIYPNPVKDFIIIRPTTSAEHYKVEVTDVNGHSLDQIFLNGSTEVKLDARKWSTGVYFVNLYDRNNNRIATERVVKL